MDNEQGKRLIDALLSFVERASKENATEAEIAALAPVARELLLVCDSLQR